MSDSLQLMHCSTPGSSVPHMSWSCSNSCPSSWWCHPTISSSVTPFSSSCTQTFPASGSFPMSQIKIILASLTSVLMCPLENSPYDSAAWVTLYFSWVELLSHWHPEGKGSRMDVPACGSACCPGHSSAPRPPAACWASRFDPQFIESAGPRGAE